MRTARRFRDRSQISYDCSNSGADLISGAQTNRHISNKMSAEMKTVCTGSDYLYTPDGGGGVMADHYRRGNGFVANSAMGFDANNKWTAVRHCPVYKVDTYSTGVCPGFTLPEIDEAKAQRDLYEKERQIELTFAMREDCGDDVAKANLDDVVKPKMQLVFASDSSSVLSPIAMKGVEEKDEVKVDGFTLDEWEAMASLVD